VRSTFQILLGLVIAVVAFEPSAHAQSNAIYLVTYVEAEPDAIAPASALLKKYRDASSHEDGNLRSESYKNWSDRIGLQSSRRGATRPRLTLTSSPRARTSSATR
jgi:hypothetical protein